MRRKKAKMLIVPMLGLLGILLSPPASAQDFGCRAPGGASPSMVAVNRASLVAAERAFSDQQGTRLAYLRCLETFAEDNLDGLSEGQRDRLIKLYRSQIAAIKQSSTDWNATYRNVIDRDARNDQ